MRKIRHLALAVICALCVAAIMSAPAIQRFHDLDLDILHAIAHVLPTSAAPEAASDVAVVALDEKTYATPPFAGLPRVMWTPQIAAVQDAILDSGASVIGWDVIFPVSAVSFVADKDFDRPLLRSFANAKKDDRIVLGAAQIGNTKISPDRIFSWAAGGPANMRSLNVVADADGVVRRIPVFFPVQDAVGKDSYVPSMALELAARKSGKKAARSDDGETTLGGKNIRGISDDAVVLNFSSEPGNIPTYSFADLYQCAEAGNSSFFREHFAGKVVLFGLVLDIEDRKLASNRFTTDGGPPGPVYRCGERSPDTPGLQGSRSTTSGVYLHATAVSNILHGRGLERLPFYANAALGLPLALLTAIVTVSFGLIVAVVAWIAGSAIWIAVATVSFSHGLILPLLLPLLAGALTFALVLGLKFTFLDKDARFLRRAFASYIAPSLVDHLVKDPGRLKLGGERREMSFLFTDLEGFTGLIEQHDPDDAVGLLNVYLDQMIKIAKRHGGTIDKVVGDGVTVIFGAPVDQADHAQRAVDCALEMDNFASQYSLAQQYRDVPFGQTRIGVNSGSAIVGNFGGKEFFDYTAHGDAINTAARLESANKQFGTRIVISSTTRSQCAEFEGRPIGSLILKGKTRAIDVYEPLYRDGQQSDLFEEYTSAFERLERKDPRATRAFAELAQKYPNDKLTQFHLERLKSGETGATIRLSTK